MSRLLFVCIVLGGVAVTVPIGVYVTRFGAYPISRNPADFGVFGDYLGGTTNVVIGILNLIIFSYLAITVSQIERRHAAKALLFTVCREWNSEELYKNRLEATNLVRRNPTFTLQDYDTRREPEFRAIWVVLSFYLDLSASIRHGIITPHDALDLFGSTFFWWDVVLVRGDYPANWNRGKDWRELKSTFEKLAPSDVEQWRNHGNTYLQCYLDEYKAHSMPPDGQTTK